MTGDPTARRLISQTEVVPPAAGGARQRAHAGHRAMALRQRARLNEKTIADFTRVVEEMGIVERGVAPDERGRQLGRP
jgi:hypothetical protein